MSSHDTDPARAQKRPDPARAQVEAANLETVFAAFPDDVLMAMEQAVRYNKAISEQKIPKRLLRAIFVPEPNP
ncbi:hypothetical protein AA309_24935 [Microvirga vignae]|uniref:Uncharacterized protein n=1 Tax=Microvirga vignae TaxID=1225564 RepID=A0A0H1R5S2_9HYPH|nr:hypothetical protein [Microvirga vignae]KLK90585.1 hypothetical protein AA309_24935 [Microvirga vignae]